MSINFNLLNGWISRERGNPSSNDFHSVDVYKSARAKSVWGLPQDGDHNLVFAWSRKCLAQDAHAPNIVGGIGVDDHVGLAIDRNCGFTAIFAQLRGTR
jgi:hypothetical protein